MSFVGGPPYAPASFLEMLVDLHKRKTGATLVIGAGELGMAMLRALTAAGLDPERRVDVALRPADAEDPKRRALADALRAMRVGIVDLDLTADPVARLAAVFADYATVICCSGFVAGPGTQRKVTAAVLQAGVDRYVPWQFGVDYDVVGRGSGQDVFDEQLEVREMLRAQSRTHWVIVSTGMFTSFLFEPSFGVVDLDRPEVRALGSWRNRLTVTTPDDIGHLTAAVLAHTPRIDDEVVYVAGDTFTYAQLADMLDRHLGRTVARTLWPLDTLRADAAAHPGDAMRKYHLAFARDDGVAWDMARTFNAAQGIPVTDVPSWLRRHRPTAPR